jgi:SET domain-containing protein
MSYLFDMNDPDDEDPFEMEFQRSHNDDFFPLCLDAAFHGNESRFINHSCDPNLKSFNLITDVECYTYHRIGLFAIKKINKE